MKARVVFIVKTGKPSHTVPKDFRPSNLSSFLLKIVENMIDLHKVVYLVLGHPAWLYTQIVKAGR